MAVWLEKYGPHWQAELKASQPVANARAKYEIGTSIGKGTYGRVYRLVERQNSKAAAMKVLTLDTDDALIEAATEWQIMLTASGQKNIISFKEAFYSDLAFLAKKEPKHPQMWLVMELCRTSLKEYLEHFREVFDHDRVAWSRDLCTGLGHLRKCHIMHRDVKPLNLCLQRCCVRGQDILKITDFGSSCIAVQNTGRRPLETNLRRLASRRCTYSYAAPEV